MPDLMNTQRSFAQAIRASCSLDIAVQQARMAQLFTSDDATVVRRIAVYRGNAVAAISKALAAAYPVIEQLVGNEFFNGLARQYWMQTPSRSGDLHEYGAGFAEFLAHFEPAVEFPYLPDVARLEWAVQQAAAAADASAWDVAQLAAVTPEQQMQLNFSFTPGTVLIASAYPIVRLWQIHQPGFDGGFEVDWDSAETALVIRPATGAVQRVLVDAIDAGCAAFIRQQMAGAGLGDAVYAALEVDPGSAVQERLGEWLGKGFVCGHAFV